MIQVENLQKTYRSGFWMRPKKAIDGVSFHVPKGVVYGFIGPNGAGKSTTIKLLMGLLRKDSGKILVAGHEPSAAECRKHLGYSPEQPYFYDYLTGRELMRFYGRLCGLEGKLLEERIAWSLSLLNADKDWVDRRLRTYSKGMMQRIGIAQAILSKPELLVLDEPPGCSGSDPFSEQRGRYGFLFQPFAFGCGIDQPSGCHDYRGQNRPGRNGGRNYVKCVGRVSRSCRRRYSGFGFAGSRFAARNDSAGMDLQKCRSSRPFFEFLFKIGTCCGTD